VERLGSREGGEGEEENGIPVSRRSVEFYQHDFLHYICQIPDIFWRSYAFDQIDSYRRHGDFDSMRGFTRRVVLNLTK